MMNNLLERQIPGIFSNEPDAPAVHIDVFGATQVWIGIKNKTAEEIEDLIEAVLNEYRPGWRNTPNDHGQVPNCAWDSPLWGVIGVNELPCNPDFYSLEDYNLAEPEDWAWLGKLKDNDCNWSAVYYFIDEAIGEFTLDDGWQQVQEEFELYFLGHFENWQEFRESRVKLPDGLDGLIKNNINWDGIDEDLRENHYFDPFPYSDRTPFYAFHQQKPDLEEDEQHE
jgi:hypothetical protein